MSDAMTKHPGQPTINDSTDPANNPTTNPTTSRAHLHLPGRHSRREFLRRSALLAGLGVAAPWALDLAGLTSASDTDADDGYKALVCIFLFGGNDHNNTMVPYDTASYNAYRDIRTTIARDRGTLLPLNPLSGFNDGRSLAFTPEWARLKQLFDQGHLATVSNVGTLIAPITKTDYDDRSTRPPQLFSHNDQQSLWQSSAPEGATTGWGGRLADLLLDDNGSDSVFTCISVAGNAVMMTGDSALQFQVSSGGPVVINPGFRSSSVLPALEEVMRLNQGGLFPSSYAGIATRGLDASDRLSNAYDSAGPIATTFPDGRLGKQLRTVAHLIEAGRTTLGLRRQVFFVATGGFDNHNELNDRHPQLLANLDESISAFYDATVELGISDEVTAFTASDFGRTLTSNGDGTDHGWGGHHIVVGGSVRGRHNYGQLPVIADDGPDDVGRGRLLPTTGVEQYASTLARWMGAAGSELNAVSPNIGRFDTDDLGFLARDPDPAVGGVTGGTLQRATRGASTKVDE